MKNLLTLFTMLLLCIGSTWAQDLDRSGWTILASSACDDGGSGQVNALTDGSTTTFWHSRFPSGANGYGDSNGGCPHAIQIDLGSVQEFNGIRISNRTDASGNGRVAGYEVYVSNTAFTTSTSGFRANDVKGDATPVLSGTFTNTAQGAVNMAGSKTKLSGRYVLFVITSSVNVQGVAAAYACIAEVNLFSIPNGSNAYIGTYNGTNNEVNQTKWQTETNWITTDTWNSNGPGYSNSNMWSPIYLNGVTATGISFEGWNLRIKLVNSSLTATAKKLQAQNVTSQFDVDQDSELDLTLLSPIGSGGGNDPGTHTFNIDGSMTITTVSGHFAGSSTNTVNLGTTGSFTFKADADAAVTIGNNAPFTLNATLSDPSAENTPEPRTLATFTNVTVSSLNVTIDGTDGWTQVASQAALQQQFYNGKYYCVEKNNSSGVTLYTFNETRRTTHTVTSDATLSDITYGTYDNFIVNSGVTLTVDVEDFDLTRITGEGNIVLAASTSLTGNKATAATGKLTVNAGKTLTIGGGQSETNSVSSFTSIDLLGTIYHKNSAATLNNVTVPAEATGIIYSHDMGSADDGCLFLLAGTTTVNGTLKVCNRWNFQMKVDQLVGSGTWTTYGTNSGEAYAEGTSSSEAATINVADSPSFTGTVNMNSTNATTNVNGTLQANTIAGAGKLAGTGTVRLLTFPGTSAPNLTGWTGTVEFPAVDADKGNLTAIFNAWGNTGSTIKLNNVKGHLFKGQTVNPVLNLAGTLTIVNGYSGTDNPSPVLQKVTGAGTLALTWTPNKVYCIEITELSDFNGTLQGHAVRDTYIRINVGKYTVASAPSVDEKLFNASGDVTLASLYVGETDQTSAYAWAVSTKDDVSGMYVTASAQQNITDAITLANTYYSQRLMGTGTGKYAVYIGETGYTDFYQFGTAVSAMTTLAAWDGKDVRAVINQPTSGYYKLKSKYNEETGYYLQCENLSTADDTNAKQTTTTDAKNIFYITVGESNSTIKSYVTGYYFGKYTRANYTADTANPAHWTFTEGYNKGTYTLTSDYSGSTILYGWSGRNNNFKADRNGSPETNGHTDWILEPVAAEDLPVIVAPGSTDKNKKILGHIQTEAEVQENITAGTAFVDLSEATITGTNIDAIKGVVAEVNPNAIIIAPQGTVPGSATTNVLLKADEGKYTCNNLQLTDDIIPVFEAGTIFTGTDVTYNRATSANQWGTICLPYAVSTDGDVAYYRLVAPVGDQTLRFERVTEETTTAYVPYLIKKAADAGLAISASDAEFTLGNPAPQVEYDGFVLKGTMVNTSVIDGTNYTEAKDGYQQAVTDPNAYYFEASSNTFRALNGRFNLKAFRAYLTATFTSSDSARSILSIDISEDGQATGISFVESEDGKTVDVVFDLNGRRLQEARKGINIINGKKVIK